MITEDQLEQLAIQWFQDTGWSYVNGTVISPEGEAPEREDFWAVVLKGRFADASVKIFYLLKLKLNYYGNNRI